MRSMIKKKRIAANNLNWDDDAEKFLAFKEKAGYMTGFIQGSEWMINTITASRAEEESLVTEIKNLETSLKDAKKNA